LFFYIYFLIYLLILSDPRNSLYGVDKSYEDPHGYFKDFWEKRKKEFYRKKLIKFFFIKKLFYSGTIYFKLKKREKKKERERE
jgi:hypothetical protein